MVDVIRQLARQKESQLLEGHLFLDHVHVYLARPSKYALAQVDDYIIRKEPFHIARTYGGRALNCT